MLLVQDEPQEEYEEINEEDDDLFEYGAMVLQEMDGVRIIGRRRHAILRKLPREYIKVFESIYMTPSEGKQLYDGY